MQRCKVIVLLLNQKQYLFAKQLEIENEILYFVICNTDEKKQRFPLCELQQLYFTILHSKYLHIHFIYKQFRVVLLSIEDVTLLATNLKSCVTCEQKQEQQLSLQYLQSIHRIITYFDSELQTEDVVWEDQTTKHKICCKDVWRIDQNLLNDVIIDYSMYITFEKQKQEILYLQTDFFIVLHRSFERSLSFVKTISLLDKKFIFIPFCLQHHWMLFCVYEIGNKDLRKIILFDSLDYYFETLQLEIIMLRRFLSYCISLETNTSITFDASNLRVKKAQVPLQSNSLDCGVYILLYMDKMNELMQKEWCDKNLFSIEDVNKKRSEIVSWIYHSCFVQSMNTMLNDIEV